MIAVGVQTWGTDAAALRRYWALADDLGFARIAYGDGLGAWTLDGWTALGAMAVLTRTARLGPAVTYAFDPAAHHPSWLAKRVATLDHLSGGRAELRLGIGAEDGDAARGWAEHGIPYPPARARVGWWRELPTARRQGSPISCSDSPIFRPPTCARPSRATSCPRSRARTWRARRGVWR